MKFKFLIALAACAVSAAATAQMPPRGPGPGQHMDRSHMNDRGHRAHRRTKVWVPAHREHGRRVAGHYVWR